MSPGRPLRTAWRPSICTRARLLLDELAQLRFTGEILALPEGSIAFPNEPRLRVTVARSSYIGGCANTSFLKAALEFRLPATGTVPHALIELFPSEE
jgi:nicotinic acid phosphoribosyltransferase